MVVRNSISTPLVLCVILLLAYAPVKNASAESVEICCDSTPVELHLLGSAGSGTLTPFVAELMDESEEEKITDAISQKREIGRWSIDPAWTGSFPSSTWEFSIQYEVENAGGAQINGSVIVEIAGESYVGSTNPPLQFLPPGEGKFEVDVNVDSGAISSSSRITVKLEVQHFIFTVPGADAGLTFSWGGVDDESTVSADIPLVDLILDEPTTEGMEVYVSMVVASPFGQMTSAHANVLDLSVNNAVLSGEPIKTSSGEFVRLTWTWNAIDEGEQTIVVGASIQIQAGTPILSGSTEFVVSPFDDGEGGSGGFYPSEEPLRTDGSGTPLITNIDMIVESNEDYITLERVISLSVDQEIAYWMRWGMDNIGNDDPALSQPLRIFKNGMVGDEERRNRLIDGVEKNEFETQMVNLAITYMNDGMALELEELIGTDVLDLERISFSVDLRGDNRVTPHPLTLRISTLEILPEDEVTSLMRNFIKIQPSPIWSSLDLNIRIDTGMMTSLTGAQIKGEDSIDLKHRRTIFGETIEISGNNLEPSATFTLSAMPSDGLQNTPLSLSIATLLVILGGLWISLRISKNKRRGAIYMEMILIPIALVSLYLAYPPFTVGVICAIAITIWIITAVASPTKKGLKNASKNISYPTIECPACDVLNSITSNERPLRIPCNGCSRILKIVE